MRLQTLALSLLCAAGFTAAQAQQSVSMQELQRQFQNPGKEAQMRVWWHWMNGNITKDGIRKDLLWMKRSHIGGVQAFDAALQTPQIVENRLIYMDEGWKDAFKYATQLADSLDMEMAIASSPGWSATGGPWVQPEDAMKKVVWREVIVNGGGKKALTVKLPEPFDVTGTFQNASQVASLTSTAIPDIRFYRDIAVLAYRLPEKAQTLSELGASVSSSGGSFSVEQLTDGDFSTNAMLPRDDTRGFAWIQYEFPQPTTIKALAIADGHVRSEWQADPPQYLNTLLASNDGVSFREVCKIPVGGVQLQTITIPTTTAKYFRVQVPNPPEDRSLVLYGGPVRKPEGTTIPEFVLYPDTRINHAEEKAGFAAEWDLEHFPTPAAAGDEVVAKNDIVDVTSFVDASGNLTWKAPAGRWKIVRFGYSLTGKQNHPAPPEATGLEVDKLDPVAWHKFFTTYFNMYKDATGGLIGKKGIQYILTDSYEAGQENWTPALMQEFEKRRGYSLLPWMPVLTGQIVGSTEESEQFLWDWRKTFTELIAENYDMLTDIAQKEWGMLGRYSESHENGRLYLVDGMDVKRRAQVPMSAIWMPGAGGGSAIPMAIADIRESASVAHVYGQNIAAAESMTAIGFNNLGYSYHPGSLKPVVDLEFAHGLNRIVVHESAHQPVDDKKPGLGLMIFGQWFNRHETWAEQAYVWADYVARSCYLLQQGRFVADVLYYYGEDNNIAGLFGHYQPTISPSYAYDFCNPDALLNQVSVRDGKVVTKSGMEYRVLYLDQNARRMSLPVLRKLAELAHQGAVIAGTIPEIPASLTDDKDEFQRLVADIWYGGRANVLKGVSVDESLEALSVAPDFTYGSETLGLGLRYVHRTLAGGDIYWVSNPTEQRAHVKASFRVTGKKPQIWHAETGLMEDASYRMTADGRTVVDLDLTVNDAQFVLFIDNTTQQELSLPAKTYTHFAAVDGAWTVTFDQSMGGPASATFDKLVSYTERPETGIKYYSGTATYTTRLRLTKKQLQSAQGADLLLELGDVKNLAEVTVNGQNLGIVWKQPYCVDATAALKEGDNVIEVKVINAWVNRLIGDLQPDATQKYTYAATSFYQANSPLKPSGLLGPVSLVLRK